VTVPSASRASRICEAPNSGRHGCDQASSAESGENASPATSALVLRAI